MIAGAIKMNARQFLELGEDPPGVRLELVDGEVVVSPSPTPGHSNVDTELRSLLHHYVREHDLGRVFGDVDTVFGDNDVRRPDLLYFARKRLHLIGDKAMEGPPDLCVEIVSPKSGKTDRIEKFKQYEAGRVAHYWIIDPRERSVEGYRLRRGKYVLTGKGTGDDIVRLPPFEDLDIPLGRLWLPDFRKRRRRR
jgi:Uma2 family endonuclease